MNNTLVLLKRYWKPLLGLNGFLVAVAIANYFFSPRVWVANSQLIMPNGGSTLDTNLGTLGTLSGSGVDFSSDLNPLKIQTSILTSQNVLQRVLASDPEKAKFPNLATYQKLFKVKPEDQSTNIVVEVRGSSPEVAKARATIFLKIYQQRLNELRRNADSNRDAFVQSQLKSAEADLLKAQTKLAQYQKATGLVNPDEQTKSLVGTINTLTSTQAQVNAEARAAATRVQILGRQLSMSPQTAIDSLRLSENKEYQAIRAKLSEIDTSLADLKGVYLDSSPQIQDLLTRRQELAKALNQQLAVVVGTRKVDKNFGGNNVKDTQNELIMQLAEAQAEGNGLLQQGNQLESKINQLTQRLSSYSTQQGKLLELQRNYDIAEGTYKGIVAQMQKAKVSAFDFYPNVQVLDQPDVDPKADSPKGSLIALGGLLASLCGSLALILFLESRNPLLKPKDLEEIELPVLGQIPLLEDLVPERNMTEQIEVEFQRLASAISLMPLANHRLMVSSSSLSEGKTSITLGLALALTDLGFRVLLVDGDYRRASLSERLGYRQAPAGSDRWTTPVTVHPRLELLPTVPRSDSRAIVEWIAQGHFDRTLTNLQNAHKYDYVIVDSAPAGLTSETALMGTAIANVLLVVRMGITDRQKVHETLAQFNRHQAQIIGLTLNGVEASSNAYTYYRKENSQVSL
jgi:polysaccharide biosynthesis transport protein